MLELRVGPVVSMVVAPIGDLASAGLHVIKFGGYINWGAWNIKMSSEFAGFSFRLCGSSLKPAYNLQKKSDCVYRCSSI